MPVGFVYELRPAPRWARVVQMSKISLQYEGDDDEDAMLFFLETRKYGHLCGRKSVVEENVTYLLFYIFDGGLLRQVV